MNINGLPAFNSAIAERDLKSLQSGNSEDSSFGDALAAASGSQDKDKLKTAGKQFEALIMGQVLKTSREASDGGWLGTGENDQAGSMAVEMAEAEFAKAMTSGNGLGIAKFVSEHLDRKAAKPASSGLVSPPSPAPENTGPAS